MTSAAEGIPEPKRDAPRSLRRVAWAQFRRHRLAVASLIFLLFTCAAVFLTPLILDLDPNLPSLSSRNSPPSSEHWLGTDQIGRDIFARLIYGGRVSLLVGIVATLLTSTIATVLGLVSGYAGGKVDNAIQRFTEIVMTFPSTIIIITVVALVGPSLTNLILALGLLNWPGLSRIIRAETLSVKNLDYVEGARASGASHIRMMARHVLPNILAPVIVGSTLGVAGAILAETGLSFLGLGVQPPTPTWGNMINSAVSLSVLENYPWIWLPPGLMISLVVLAVNFLGDALRDALDPRIV